MIQITVSAKTRTASWPRSSVPDYSFSVRSYGGPALGVGLHEFDWTMEIDSRRALVSVEYFRSDADIPGQPIGLFRMPSDDRQLREIYDLIRHSRLAELQPAHQGHPGYTQRVYLFNDASRQQARQLVNDADEQTNASLAPLRTRLNTMLAASFKSPERAAQIAIRHARQQPGEPFEITVTNIGVERICFTDPRSIGATGPQHRAVVMITEFPEAPPGESPPLNWRPLALQPPAGQALVLLDPGAEWKIVSAGLKRAPGRRYLAYFTWSNYTGEPMVDGTYRLRGRVDSPRLVIQP